MKEKYVSPVIFFESFALSQTIARNCGDTHNSTLGESNHYNEYSCQWVIGGDIKLFFEAPCDDLEEYGIDIEAGDDIGEVFEGVCYNNPDGGQMLFSST